MQLPYENRPWAKRVAALIIVSTILLEIGVIVWLRKSGPLDFPEILALVLFLIAVVPPSLHVIRGKSYYAADGRSGMHRGGLPVHK